MVTRFVTALVLVVFTGGTALARSVPPAQPAVMAAIGDSISAGFNACGWWVACTSRSWSAGDNEEVDSHYLRLLASDPALGGHNLNFAVPGATSADMVAQARQAVAAHADYVTLLIGAGDVCTGGLNEMTPITTYRQRVDAALAVLRPAGVRVLAASIPDIKHLWRIGKDDFWARTFWSIGGMCPVMLDNPESTARMDVIRRDRVRDRLIAYNTQMSRACAAYGPGCRYDGGAVFRYPFKLEQVSGWDYFHPNGDGQKALAAATFKTAQALFPNDR
ncbi:SGNH/GDSL hydrolase family protein [Streptosporangiaceae bacterium NEAU-GS5]|nr:SGNH/GDSL hydrolase family protein [Streptosporangiaceae bacterium NEAU-GS5]